MSGKATARLGYIDWMRGLACVLMFQWHCYNSWLTPEAQKSALYGWAKLGGTFPAPLFIFLSGVSFALVTQKLREKGAAPNAVAKTTVLRGAEIFGLAMLFRVQEFALGYRWAPWTDLLRVDVLNILGLGMMLMGVLCWLTAARWPSAKPTMANANTVAVSRARAIVGATVAAAAVALASPLLWTTARPRWLPWPIESYINGVHVFDAPQPWLFPLFPWSAFAFAGLAVGFFLFSEISKRKEGMVIAGLGALGVIACAASVVFDRGSFHLYSPAIYDYWHTSPNFFLLRCGLLLVILFFTYAWCQWGLAQKGFSPIIQLGNTSLLVYWVHIEFVYGRFSLLPKGRCGIAKATLGLLAIFLMMLILSILRTWRKRRPAKALRAELAAVAATAESG